LGAETLGDRAGVTGGGDDGVTVCQGGGGDFGADATGSAGDELDTFEGVGSSHERVPCLRLG
jgi:hypothetical protein